MSRTVDFDTAFTEARKLHANGSFAEAEQAYRAMATPGANREIVLQALLELYLQTRRPTLAADVLVELTEEQPDSLSYYARLASLLDGLGDIDGAIAHYERLLKRQPELAAGHFNVALLYKRTLRYQDALLAYEKAASLGIDGVQEVYSNTGVLYSDMRRPAKAREMYMRALEVDPAYVPALFNLAALHEESGEREQAVALYRRIHDANPAHADSLCRLANIGKLDDRDDPLIDILLAAVQQSSNDPLAQEGLYFALGKVLDDVELYEEAFTAYTSANTLGSRRSRYDRQAAEQGFDQIIRLFDTNWLASAQTRLKDSPIFICGMYRSGSTLVEQMLGAHPAITAGGELDFLPWLIAHRLTPSPEQIESTAAPHLQPIGEEYLARVQELFPDAEHVTDKRPDNFLHLGLVRSIFPSVRIVYTHRRRQDNCLSVFFQQLGEQLGYAADLHDIDHYYRLHTRLMDHWQSSFGENIFTVDYDQLVQTPEPVLRQLLEFLGLEWDKRCLEFWRSDNTVKTASIWQVREGLHTGSSGRWQNYRAFIPDVEKLESD